MPQTIIIGSGVIGKLLQEKLSLRWPTACIPARSVMRKDWSLPAEFASVGRVVFAHGTSVNVYGLRWRAGALLENRLDVVMRVRAQLPPAQLVRAVLVSSTAAYLPRKEPLSLLQQNYEEGFHRLFAGTSSQVLRVGTLVSPSSQLVEGLYVLRRSLLYARLRLRQPTAIPWTDETGLVAGVASALASDDEQTVCVAHACGLDFNAVMERMVGKKPTWRLPTGIFHLAWRVLAIQPAFFTISTSMIPLSHHRRIKDVGTCSEPNVDKILAQLK